MTPIHPKIVHGKPNPASSTVWTVEAIKEMGNWGRNDSLGEYVHHGRRPQQPAPSCKEQEEKKDSGT
jgi:hypothetical protein